MKRLILRGVYAVTAVLLCTFACAPTIARADDTAPKPVYQTLEELTGKRFAYVNGSVYGKNVEAKVEGTTESYYAALPDCVAAVEAGKADAAVQLSYCCQLVVNRKGGTVALLPESVDAVEEAFFFPQGDPLVAQFDQAIDELEQDGTIEELTAKWVGADEDAKTLPEQDWEAPNGTLKFATSGVLEPFSYVGAGGEILGYDVDLALHIAQKLGYHLKISTITMDAIFASVQTGKVDFGGTLTRTDEREKMVDFTKQVMPTTIAVIVKAEGADAAGTDGGFFGSLRASFERTFIEEERWKLIANGLAVTLLISVCAGVLGIFVGFGVVLMRHSGVAWAIKLVDIYQAIMGGVPLVVVLMVLYYVVFGSANIAGELVAILAFALSFGSTAGTTLWTAVQGVGAIQEEAGLALGFSPSDVFSIIVFPQALQRCVTQLLGQFVGLVKETAIVGYIAVQDLTRASDLIRSRTMEAFFPLISTAIIYFVFCRILSRLLGTLGERLDNSHRPHEVKGVK